MKKMNYDFLNELKYMPPLKHAEKDEPFDITKSEAAKWMAAQPAVMQKVFDMASCRKVITYNPETNTWQGVDYNGD